MPSQKTSKKVQSKVSKKTTKQTAGAKKTVAKKTVAKKAAPVKKTTKASQKGGAKKTVAKKTVAKKTVAKKTAPAKQEGGKKTKVVRSFKVQLPGTEEYSGRFTGSTPYQAANKALSKYFRTVENPKSVVTFSIRESTRGSKHGVYTYEGHRIKLETPVTYTIGEGNTITKHHKNQLKKVKKADLAKKENL